MVRRSRQHAHLERARTISSSPGPNETSALLRAFLVRINSQQERQHQQTQLRESSPRTPSPPASSSALPRTPSPISRSSYIPPRTPRSRRRNDTREAAERNILLTPPRRRRPARVFTTPISPISRSQRVFATPRSQQRGLSGRRQATQLATPTRTRQRAQPAQGSISAPPNITTAGFYYATPVQTQAWKPQQDVARTPLQQNIDYRFILATATHSCTLCGALYWIEERKVNTTKIKPQFTCCVNGAVQIPPQPQYPAVLQKLLADCVPGEQRRTRRSVEFHQFIRHYNNSFSFCSLGAEIDDQLARQLTGVYTFRAHGQLYHRIGSLRAQGNTNPSFAQLYIFDSDEEQLQLRQRAFPNLNTQILRTIQQCLTTVTALALEPCDSPHRRFVWANCHVTTSEVGIRPPLPASPFAFSP
jgi:hypothetical protein